jgi:hypothetical protein
LEISGLDFEYIVNKDGQSNIDFLLDSFLDTSTENTQETIDSTETSLDFSADKFKLKDIRIQYFDSLNKMGGHLHIPEISIKAKTQNNVFKGKTDGSLILSHCLFEDTKVDQMESCRVDFDMEYENDEARIDKLTISSEGISLGMEGTLTNKTGIGINANFELSTLDLNILKKYAPDEYIKPFENTIFAKVAPIRLDLNADYKEERVDIKKLVLQSEGIDIGAKGIINQKDTLRVDADIQSLNLDFNVLKNYIPAIYLKEYGIIDLGGKIDVSASINGSYVDSTHLPMIDAKVGFEQLSIHAKGYPQIDTINLLALIKTKGKPDLSEATIQFSKGEIISSTSKIQFDGSIAGIENPQYNFHSNLDINLIDFAQLIPDSLASSVVGNITASINTRGVLPETITDDFMDDVLDNSSITMQFSNVTAAIGDTLSVDDFSTFFKYSSQKAREREIQIDKLSLKSEDLNLNLKNSSISAIATGKMSDPMQMGVQLNAFNIQNGNMRVFGNGSLKNFQLPDFEISTTIDLQMKELVLFVPDSLIKSMSGFASAKIYSRGTLNLDSLDTQLMKVLFENSSFELSMVNASVAFTDSIMDIDKVSGTIKLKNDVLEIPYFSASYRSAKLELDSTRVNNIYSAVLLNQNKELYVQSHIKIGDIIFDDFKHLMALGETETTSGEEESSADSIAREPQNWTYLIHGTATVNSLIVDSLPLDDFNINKLHIHDMSTLFKLTDSSYIMDQFKFKAFEGEMNNSIHYKLREDGTSSVSARNLISNMNMRTLLRDMDNFGLDSLITYQNISGLLSTDLNTFVPIEDSVRLDKMMISGDLTLEKGGVYDYAPAQEISKFTGIKELDNIQFKTLRSNIFMFKNKLYVPRTNIVSNAIDIAAFGMQSLEGDNEYHLEIHLSNILFGKSKRRNKKQDTSGEEIDEESLKKSSRKIRYAVIDGESKVGLDTKDSREDMMNKIRVQRKMLDFIFFPKNIHYNTDLE